jgi:hypothetical protein
MLMHPTRQNVDAGNASLKAGDRPTAPGVLIHLHIPKTGGTSLSSMVKHGFKSDEVFEWTRHGVARHSALDLATYECCQQQIENFGLERIRYIAGHVPFGVHRVFDKPAKYITVLRHPVERVISLFYFRMQINEHFLRGGRTVTFEEYVENRCDIHLRDYQVRAVSGCPDLDTDAVEPGEMISHAAPVERRHLEVAKRNVDEHFLAIAPVEQMTDLGLLIRRIYGWPMRRLHNEYKNATKDRPSLADIPPRLIQIIEDCNSHDMELYEWISRRFAEQKRRFDRELSLDRRVYAMINPLLTTAGRVLPPSMRKRLAEILFYAK